MESVDHIEQKEVAAEIRLMQVEDIVGYIDMKKASWLYTYPNEEYGITYEMVDNYTSRRSLEQKLEQTKAQIEKGERGNTYILHVDNKVAGVVAFQLNNEKEGQIRDIYLSPEFIGQGFGTTLMTFALNELTKLNVKGIIIEVAKHNMRAIRFYEKFGFVIQSRQEIKFEIAEGVFISEIILRKIL